MVRRSSARVGALALAVLIGGGLGACGGGGEDFGDETLEGVPNGGLNNEDVLADPATVVEGIGVIKDLVNDVMNKIGSEDAEIANEAILPVWEDVEGRIKSEAPATHSLLEAQFVALTAAVEKKDSAAARAAGDAIIKALDTYLTTPRTASPSPSATSSTSPSPSSTAIPTVSPSSTSTSTATSTPSATASPTP